MQVLNNKKQGCIREELTIVFSFVFFTKIGFIADLQGAQ
jgi:hypothetical protein